MDIRSKTLFLAEKNIKIKSIELYPLRILSGVKKLVLLLILIAVFAACNNDAEDNNNSVGDSMSKDPTTGQPITTEPDTVGLDQEDSTTKKD
ncbi:MAG: hypothetical protein ABR502_06240 [Chitinophagaceae bacterium]